MGVGTPNAVDTPFVAGVPNALEPPFGVGVPNALELPFCVGAPNALEPPFGVGAPNAELPPFIHVLLELPPPKGFCPEKLAVQGCDAVGAVFCVTACCGKNEPPVLFVPGGVPNTPLPPFMKPPKAEVLGDPKTPPFGGDPNTVAELLLWLLLFAVPHGAPPFVCGGGAGAGGSSLAVLKTSSRSFSAAYLSLAETALAGVAVGAAVPLAGRADEDDDEGFKGRRGALENVEGAMGAGAADIAVELLVEVVSVFVKMLAFSKFAKDSCLFKASAVCGAAGVEVGAPAKGSEVVVDAGAVTLPCKHSASKSIDDCDLGVELLEPETATLLKITPREPDDCDVGTLGRDTAGRATVDLLSLLGVEAFEELPGEFVAGGMFFNAMLGST